MVVSCIDEVHLLAHDPLDAIRMLTNHDLDSGSPFACYSASPQPCDGR